MKSTEQLFTFGPLGFSPSDPDEKMRVATLIAAHTQDDSWPTQIWRRFVDATAHKLEGGSGAGTELLAPIVRQGLLSAYEVREVLETADALERATDPQRLRCHGVKIWTGGAHSTLYMHHEGWLADRLPTLLHRLVQTMLDQHAAWFGSGQVDELSLRCVELHEYSVGGSLSRRGHRDHGSSVSMSILLTESRLGGEFVTWDEMREPVLHTLRPGDAVVFPSEHVHNVAPVLEGLRRTMVLEIWQGDALTCGRGRDLRAGASHELDDCELPSY